MVWGHVEFRLEDEGVYFNAGATVNVSADLLVTVGVPDIIQRSIVTIMPTIDLDYLGFGGAEGDRTPDLMTASSSQAIFLNQKELNGLQPARILKGFPFCHVALLDRVGCLLSHPATIWPQQVRCTYSWSLFAI